MRHSMRRTGSLRLIGALTTMLVVLSVGVSANATTSVDNVKLTGVNGSGASGQVHIYIWDIEDNTGFAANSVVFDTQLSNLPAIRGGGSGFYTLWVFAPTIGRQLVHTFNTNGGGVKGHHTTMFVAVLGDWVVPNVRDILLSEDVRIEIWEESDDGVAGPDGPGLLVMSGSIFRPVGESTVPILLPGSCGDVRMDRCESLLGNVVTDSWRATYGTDFAILNSGGVTGDLTCPISDDPDDQCPAHSPPRFDITDGTITNANGFNNDLYTVDDVTGFELKGMLEHSVSAMPTPHFRFAQLSGLCFTYDIDAVPGSRILSAVRQGVDGACTADAINLSAAATYSMTMSVFTAGGGDGYPDFIAQSRGQVEGNQRSDLASWVAANTPISPTIDGRIACVGSSCPVAVP
ncbi:MAG: 5'-nucleotidase C-terminal domain-containing protein [Actinomycetia bacterium]|nr:5'-nucleotidase C-terminal domain-containing protein [Actinomycetes bacterium]